MTARDDVNVETWMLFCSGGATRIDVDLHEPAERGHAARVAHVVKDCDAAMRDAAERGCRAALAWVERRSGTAPACVVSFDLPDVPAGRDVGDASGGLAFAVAAARAVHAAAPGAVAAVGEIESGLRGGPLRRVEGIEAKIEGVLGRLPDGGRLVYPTGNDCEISARYRQQLNERNIETNPVASVDEALHWLFPVGAAIAPSVEDASGPPYDSAPVPTRTEVETSDDESSPAARRLGMEARHLTRWLIAIGGVGAAAVAIWYASEGLRAPTPASEQTTASTNAATPIPSSTGQGGEDRDRESPVAAAALPATDTAAREGAPPDSSLTGTPRDHGFDAPPESSSKEASNDGGFD